MPQEFLVLRCFACNTFQVQQKKKKPKWSCKMCGEKQSVKKVYGKGSGAECRKLVQTLNMTCGQIEENKAEEETTTDYGEAFEGYPSWVEDDNFEQTTTIETSQEASKWSDFLSEVADEPPSRQGGQSGFHSADVVLERPERPRGWRSRRGKGQRSFRGRGYHQGSDYHDVVDDPPLPSMSPKNQNLSSQGRHHPFQTQPSLSRDRSPIRPTHTYREEPVYHERYINDLGPFKTSSNFQKNSFKASEIIGNRPPLQSPKMISSEKPFNGSSIYTSQNRLSQTNNRKENFKSKDKTTTSGDHSFSKSWKHYGGNNSSRTFSASPKQKVLHTLQVPSIPCDIPKMTQDYSFDQNNENVNSEYLIGRYDSLRNKEVHPNPATKVAGSAKAGGNSKWSCFLTEDDDENDEEFYNF